MGIDKLKIGSGVKVSPSELIVKNRVTRLKKGLCGIYKINFVNDTFYIGQTQCFLSRFSTHNSNVNTGQKLSFSPIKNFEILELEPDSRIRKLKEIKLISEMISNPLCVNHKIGCVQFQHNMWIVRMRMRGLEYHEIAEMVGMKKESIASRLEIFCRDIGANTEAHIARILVTNNIININDFLD